MIQSFLLIDSALIWWVNQYNYICNYNDNLQDLYLKY